jgi:ElaA protein
MYTIVSRSFSDLSVDELYDLLKLRQEVFVVEQDCVYQDLDDLDRGAMHFLCLDEKSQVLMGYARLIAPDVLYPEMPAIGRVVVNPEFRKKGLGKQLMRSVIAYSRKKYGELTIRISAQRYLESFYTDLGFQDTGEHYLEDGIPHMAMLLEL